MVLLPDGRQSRFVKYIGVALIGFLFIWILFHIKDYLTKLGLNTKYTPFRPTNSKEYERLRRVGADDRAKSTVLICGMVRDVERNLASTIDRVEAMGRLFKDYQVWIVENDSTDNTRKILLEWATKNQRVTILGCGVNADSCLLNLPKTIAHEANYRRISKMAYLRNIYLNRLKQQYTSGLYQPDYVMVWDLDLVAAFYQDGIEHSLGYLSENPDVNAICAYGFSHSMYRVTPEYYDPYAIKYYEGNPNSHNEHDEFVRMKERLPHGHQPYLVKSCFGGFVIYKTPSLLRASYGTARDAKTGRVECEHVYLHSMMDGIVSNPSMRYSVFDNPI